jgi:hypothetical protein
MTEPSIQLLDDLEAEFARVAAERASSPRRARVRALAASPPRALAVALTVLILLGGAAYVVPPTRAAIEDLTSTFAGWIAGDDDQAPGSPPQHDAPRWVREEGARLIAERAGVGLYVTRTEIEAGTVLDFTLGHRNAVTIGATVEGWRERFGEHAAVVLGWTPFGGEKGLLDEHGRVPVLGVTARSVTQIELRYEYGPPLVATDIDGGFVLIADAWRPFRELVAYDAAGKELEQVDVRYLDLRYLCDKEPGC